MTIDTQTQAFLHPSLPPLRSSLKHLPLVSLRDSYFRSKILTTTIGINPLVTAAAALFTLATHLREQTTPQDSHELYQQLIHEVKAFETQTQNHGYRAETTLVARYILCALLDEILSASIHNYKLLTVFHGEEWGGERFFIILDRLSLDPAAHIDLLELFYICLSQGFTGKYQMLENGKAELEKVTEKLFECIRWQRGNIKKELAILSESPNQMPASQPSHRTLPVWLLIIFTLVLLLTLYIGFNFIVISTEAPLVQQLNNLSSTLL